MNLRLWPAPPVSTPARATSRAPSRAGSEAASKTSRAPDARAISSPCPSSPKPVTSVAPRIPCRTSASEAARFCVRIWAIAASRCALDVRPWRRPLTSSPVPSRFVSSSTSPGRAPPLRSRRSGCAVPITASPNFGSGSRIVWPPASTPPASRTFAAAASNTAARAAFGKSSGNAAIDNANSTRPPIANTSESALAAAISPYSTASSTRGGKKSNVPRIARSSEMRQAAASSGGSRPAISAGSAAAPSARAPAPSPASASASRSAPSFAAQPPHSVSSVRRIGGR